MPKAKNLAGTRFGRLVAETPQRRVVNGRSRTSWVCLCDCGTRKTIPTDCLVDGRSTSCGCLHKEFIGALHFKHGYTGCPEYVVWKNIKARCFKPSDKKYHAYGGRGITMHQSWVHDFPQFLADVGHRPKGTTLDRIDNNGNYEPGNCRWATREEQSTNTRQNIWIEHDGKRKTVGQWSRHFGISTSAFYVWRQAGLSMPDIEAKVKSIKGVTQ